MTLTSFDRTTAAIGANAWRRLHLVGGYYLLFQFMVSFGMRISDMRLYALFLIPLVAVFALRMIAMAPRAQAARTGGSSRDPPDDISAPVSGAPTSRHGRRR